MLIHRGFVVALTLVVACSAVRSQETETPVNFYVHPDVHTSQYEVCVSAHPADSNTCFIVAVARNSNVDKLGWYLTTDGGATWMGADTLPTHSNLNLNMRDPGASVDRDGNLFVAGFVGPDVFVTRSTDKGVSWTQKTIISTNNHERPFMTIDRDEESPLVNSVYFVYTDMGVSPGAARFYRSTDHGLNFSSPVTISGSIGSNAAVGVNIAAGPDSMVYAAWSGFDSRPWDLSLPFHLGFNRSTNGGVTWETATSLGTVNYNGGLPKPLSFFNTPSIAVDCSQGPRRGWIYIVYAETTATTPDIFLIRSTDEGASWSVPTKVNRDVSGKDHWLPSISVDPQCGDAFVVYYDSRNFAGNDSAEVFLSRSSDGGDSFRDTVLSSKPFLPRLVWNAAPVVPYYMGSYIGVSASAGQVWAGWNDTRSGVHQVYATRLPTLAICTSADVASNASNPDLHFRLDQNYPNPFNPVTTVEYTLPRAGYVILRIYDLLGEEVATLVNGEQTAGTYTTTWDASAIPSGVYFYRLTAGKYVQTRKMVLMR